MLKHSVSFLAGAAATAAAVIFAGGAAGILIGAGLTISAVLIWGRQAAPLIIALHDAAAAFHHSRANDNSRRTTAGPTLVKPTQVQLDVIAALKAQGMAGKQARAAVLAAGPVDDFEQLFRKVVNQ